MSATRTQGSHEITDRYILHQVHQLETSEERKAALVVADMALRATARRHKSRARARYDCVTALLLLGLLKEQPQWHAEQMERSLYMGAIGEETRFGIRDTDR